MGFIIPKQIKWKQDKYLIKDSKKDNIKHNKKFNQNN